MKKLTMIRRRLVAVNTILALTIALTMGMTMDVSAASTAAKKRNAAYREKVQTLAEKGDPTTGYSYATFKIKGIKTPILYVDHHIASDMTENMFYIYRKGKVRKIGSTFAYTSGIKRYGKYLMFSSGHIAEGWTVTVLKYKGGKLKKVYHKDYYNDSDFSMDKVQRRMEKAACKKLKLKRSGFKEQTLNWKYLY